MKKLFKNGEMFLLTPKIPAYGGYESDGLVFQLDCARGLVETEWKSIDIGGNQSTFPLVGNASVGSDGSLVSDGFDTFCAYNDDWMSSVIYGLNIFEICVRPNTLNCTLFFYSNAVIGLKNGYITLSIWGIGSNKTIVYDKAVSIGSLVTIALVPMSILFSEQYIFCNGVQLNKVSEEEYTVPSYGEYRRRLGCFIGSTYAMRFYMYDDDDESIMTKLAKNSAIDQSRFNN